jgi:general secretion pathway protein H
VVLLVISIFAFLVVPRLDLTGRGDLEATAKHLGGTTRYLFNEAALSGREHRLVYDLERGSYRALRLETSGELTPLDGPGKLTRLRGEVRFRDLTVPGRGTFASGEVTTTIHPAGWLEETVVHLENRKGEQLTVHISPLTGMVETFVGYRDFR